MAVYLVNSFSQSMLEKLPATVQFREINAEKFCDGDTGC